MLNDNRSPSSPHSARFEIKTLIQAISAISQVRDPIPENITKRFILACSAYGGL